MQASSQAIYAPSSVYLVFPGPSYALTIDRQVTGAGTPESLPTASQGGLMVQKRVKFRVFAVVRGPDGTPPAQGSASCR